MTEFINKPLLMGILNVTPDSFSDGGRYDSPATALAHAEHMLNQGVDIIDVGGESTRPYSMSVSSGEQIHRVIPVIKAIRKHLSSTIPISIDTRLSSVARLALAEGANIINDVSAGVSDPEILTVAAKADCPIVLMHMQGTPQTMQNAPHYDDVVNEIITRLLERVSAAKHAGIRPERIILDPGIGFGKQTHHDLALLHHLKQLTTQGFPVLLGASRKKFMQSFVDRSDENGLDMTTAVTTALAVMAGVQIIRVHEVKSNRQALDLAWSIKHAN